jgi:poly [ADP-ribose] polymerase
MASGNIGSDKARARHAAPVEEEEEVKASSSGLSSSLHPMVQSLINYIYSEATSRLTATVSAKITSRGIETPLGVLTLAQVEKGENILDELQTLYDTNKLDSASAERLSSDFYTVIPHPIGRAKAAVMAAVLRTPEAFEQKRELLQLMKDMVQVNSAGSGVLHRCLSPPLSSYCREAIACEVSVDEESILC